VAACIACKSSGVEAFLDLGETALANKFLAPDEVSTSEPRFPLIVGQCAACGHVQLMQPVPPAAMFDDYLYISSLSTTLVAHLQSLAKAVVDRLGLGKDDLVIDIGSNDGTLLSAFNKLGVRTLGVDPAKNLAPLAEANGVETITAYFDDRSAGEIVAKYGQASAITATNVFLHIPVLDGFMAGLHRVLRPGGIFVVEAHYLRDLIEQLAFDTIYHEHCSYWSLDAVSTMFRSYGFSVFDAARLPIHHGQLRLFVSREGERLIEPNVRRLLDEERTIGLTKPENLRAFSARVEAIRKTLRDMIHEFKASGKHVAGYGAPAKGNTLLSYLGFGPDDLDYIADKSPLKQGRVTPGTHIPVVAPDRLMSDLPDYVLLLAWNFADEILAEQAAYRERGGKFILPVPSAEIV
jgi:predicted TPR repeat methyltransferase